MSKFQKIVLIIGLFLGVRLPAQTISTTTVNWTTGWCNICGPTTGNYACQSGSGSGNWGPRTFIDPSPANHTICSIMVEVDKVDCGMTNMCVSINATNVQCLNVGAGTNCNCGACWPQFYQLTQCPFPGYIKNGTNTITLNPVGNVCVSQAIITIYSNPTCISPCIVNLALEDIPKQVEEVIQEANLNPSIQLIFDSQGNSYGDKIPLDYRGIIFVRYKNGEFKKMNIQD